MIVTEIAEFSKQKVKVYIDYEFAFVLYKGELRTYQLKVGTELSQELYHKIVDEVLIKRAKLRCMNLLKSRDYTKYQLASKLRQGLYPQEVIDEAIAYCVSYRYLDDLRYAKAYIGYAQNSKSRKQIEQDLLKKGVNTEDIAAAFDDKQEKEDLVEEEELIAKILVKKHYKREMATYEERQKIIGFLYRKGFSLDKIYKVVGEID